MQCPTCKTELVPVLYDETGTILSYVCRCLVPISMKNFEMGSKIWEVVECQPQPK